MQATEVLEQIRQNSRDVQAALVPARSENMQASAHCAYNQTRECSLDLRSRLPIFLIQLLQRRCGRSRSNPGRASGSHHSTVYLPPA